MKYKVTDETDREVELTPELEALVAAYVAAWMQRFGSEPKLQHPLDAMGLVIDFD